MKLPIYDTAWPPDTKRASDTHRSPTTDQPQTLLTDRIASELDQTSPETLAERRHRWLVIFAGCFLVVALVTLLMPVPFRGRVWDQIADLLHVPCFGLINYLALSIARYHFASRWRVPLLVTFTVISFSGFIEVLQGMFGRHPSLGDLFSNSMGAVAALTIHQSRWVAATMNIRWGFRWLAMLLVAVGIARPLLALFEIYLRRS